MNLNKKIKSFISYLKSVDRINNQEDFGASLGYPNKSSFSQLLNRNDFSEKFMQKLNEVYPEFNDFKVENITSEVTPVPYDNYMVVEYADLSTAAGKLGVENPAILPEMKKRLVPKEFDEGNYLVVSVDGDSMDNGTNISVPDGTEVLIKEYHLDNGDKLPIRNNLFVIVSKTGTVFKQIIEHNVEEGCIICHSYNPKYKDFSIQLNDIIQIFIYRKIVSFRPSIPEITN